MNARLLLVAIPVLLAAAALAFVLSHGRRIGLDEEDDRDDDPVLARLREKNPGLHLARGALERFNRIPIYWVTHPQGDRVLVPRSLVDGDAAAVLRLGPCGPSAIPERLRYPRGTRPACLVIEREEERIHAFYFRTGDDLEQVVMHLDGKVGRLHRYVEETNRELERPDGSTAFSHAYWMYERPNPDHQVFALVGYRRERLRAEPGDSPDP